MENLIDSKNDLTLLTKPHPNPCVSFYVPLGRGGQHRVDELRLGQLVRHAEDLLTQEGFSREAAHDLVRPIGNIVQEGLRDLQGGKIVGLACFVAPDIQKTYMTAHATPEWVSVDRHFELRPLVELIPLEDEFYVLGINKSQVSLFQGSQTSLTPIFTPPLAHQEPAPTGESPAEQDLVGKLNTTVSLERDYKFMEEYVRSVCRDIDVYLNNRKAPLIIAATEAMQPVIAKYLKYPFVVKEGLRTPVAPERSSPAMIFDQAQKILERFHAERKKDELARYRNIAGTRFAAAAVSDILQAASRSQLEVLFVSPLRRVFGTYDSGTGHVTIHPDKAPADTELVSLAVQEAVSRGARVYLIEDQELPADCPMMGILRW